MRRTRVWWAVSFPKTTNTTLKEQGMTSIESQAREQILICITATLVTVYVKKNSHLPCNIRGGHHKKHCSKYFLVTSHVV